MPGRSGLRRTGRWLATSAAVSKPALPWCQILHDFSYADIANTKCEMSARTAGKTLAEHALFAEEIIRAIRQAVGADYPICLRISQWKLQDFTAKLVFTPQEMEAWLVPLVVAGVDIFHCSQRRFWEPEFSGSDLNFARWAKKLTGKTTITVGSVGLSGDFLAAFQGESSNLSQLDELLRRLDRGDFDLVAVGRALLADAGWAQKIHEGHSSELIGFRKEALSTLS